jgi:hypothetical protein
VSSSHKNGDCGRGIANGPTVSLQSDGPAPYRCNMVSNIPNTLAGEREINVSTQIFRVRWISSTCGRTLSDQLGKASLTVWLVWSACQEAPPKQAYEVTNKGRSVHLSSIASSFASVVRVACSGIELDAYALVNRNDVVLLDLSTAFTFD